VTIYPSGSNGNAAPSATITGANTGLYNPLSIALDANRDIYITNAGSQEGYSGVNDTVAEYPLGSSANVAFTASIEGPPASLVEGGQGIASDGYDNIYVTTAGELAAVDIFAVGSNADGPPLATITTIPTELGESAGIAIDANGNIYVNRRLFRKRVCICAGKQRERRAEGHYSR
jgi:hypothetical protein